MKNKLKIYYLLFLASFIFLPLKNLCASTLNVPGQYSSISSAISKSDDGDLILVASGTYNERLNIRKNIEIRSVSGAQATIIDGQQGGSVVFIANTKYNGSVPKISGFTIRNGKSPDGQGGGITLYNTDAIVENNIITNNSGDVDAGGILVHQNSDATIRNNTISSNNAKRFGGGLLVVYGSDALIYNNTISSNSATGTTFENGGSGGGGIYVDSESSPQIIKNTISSNHADHAGGGIALRVKNNSTVEENTIDNNDAAYGGGLHIETGAGGSPQIINNTITNNRAPYSSSFSGSGFGGGIAVYDNSTPQILGNSISGNSSTQGGGGIVISENSNVSLYSNQIFNNFTTTTSSSYEGGGIYISSATANIKNNVIFSNTSYNGGGLSLQGNSATTIENNTIVKNAAAGNFLAGGIYIRSTANSSSIKNNIITQNGDFQIFEDTAKASFSNNLINNDGDGIYFGNSGVGIISDITTFNGSPSINAFGNISGIEEFIDSGNNNYNIMNGSSAINAGSSTSLQYDIDYNIRSLTSPIDIGAYEYGGSSSKTSPVYRFWSDAKQHHFYTIEASERNTVLNTYKQAEWKYEGPMFRAYKLSNCVGNKVYRFWSNEKQGHFYTISEGEKNQVIATYPENVWKYEGEAFCAETNSSSSNTALYRFWSDTKQGHFYTANASEKDYVINNYPTNVWHYEGIGYYVYPNF